jgi:hypothetical protein
MRMPQCRHRRVRVNSRPPAVRRPDSLVNLPRDPADLLGDFPATSATYQVVRPLPDGALWLHGRLAQGTMVGIDERTMASDFTEARVGLEARSCGLHGVLCLVAGLDAGYCHERLLADYDHTRADLAAAIPRLGIDLGGTRLRVRASIETAFDQRG